MRRDTFLKSLAALAAAGSLPLTAQAATNLKMMIPANPGGGWDSTGRALGKAIMDAKGADTVQYENKGGAAGVIGLAQFARGGHDFGLQGFVELLDFGIGLGILYSHRKLIGDDAQHCQVLFVIYVTA